MSRHFNTPGCAAVEDGAHCLGKHYALDFCETHYWRMRRHGTIEKHAAGFKPQVPPIRMLGTSEWKLLRDEPTYAEEWTAGLEELFRMYGLHYVPNRFAAASNF